MATYIIKTEKDLQKPLNYAKRLLKNSKYGVKIAIERKSLPRSNNQNRYYRGALVAPIANYMGEFPDNVHQMLKQMFLLVEMREIQGQKIAITKSTAKLTTAEMEEYHQKIRIWASMELDLILLEPNEIIEN